jgi:hypothetical protein
MLGLGKHGPDGRYGVIVDIGSGSVGIAIVASDPLQSKPEIIWSHRERMVVRLSQEERGQIKNITTTLVNCMLILGAEGLKELKTHDSKAKVQTMQVSISAPWSYTVTKTVTYSKDEPFEISKRLVKELIQIAQKQALEVIDENQIIEKLGLKIITKATIDISANGYHTKNVYDQNAENISISHVSAITQEKLLEAILETADKVLPSATIEKYSFMLIYYCVLQDLNPDTTEICLIDVTAEATEIGVIRDGVMRYCTHCPLGTYTIARDMATLCEIPEEEALGYIRGNKSLEGTLSEKKMFDLNTILDTYIDSVTSLFKRTGDQLSIPRTLFIHTDDRSEAFFSNCIKKAASKATKSEHGVHLVTSKLLDNEVYNDSALLLSAYFFHRMNGCDDFEQV